MSHYEHNPKSQLFFTEVAEHIGQLLGVSHISVFKNKKTASGDKKAIIQHQWTSQEDVDFPFSFIQDHSYQESGLGKWVEQLAAGQVVQLSATDLPEEISLSLKEYNLSLFVLAPIFVNKNWWGLIAFFDYRRKRDWTGPRLKMLSTAAGVLGTLYENRQLYESECNARERAEVLREFTRIISGSLDRQEVLQQSLKQLRRVLKFDSASIYLLPRAGHSEFVAGIGFEDEKMTSNAAENLLQESPIIRRMIQSLQPVISPDVHELDGWIWVPGADHVRSFMGIPLIVRDRAIGTLMFDSRETDHYQELDLEIVEPLASQIAISIENARLFEVAQHQLHLAQTLQQVGGLLTTSLALDEVYEHIFDLLAQVVVYDSVTLQILRGDEGYLEMAAARGFADLTETGNFIASISQHSLRKFSDEHPWRVIPDTENDADWSPLPKAFTPIRSWIGASLRIKGELIGVLNVDSHTANTYDEAMGETVAAFANQAAVAIENARLHEETRQRAKEMEVLHHVAMQTAVLLDIDALLQKTTNMIASSLYPDNFGFALFDHERQILTPHASYHGLNNNQLCIEIGQKKSVVGHVVRTKKPWIVKDTLQDPYYNEVVPSTRSEIAVPVLVEGGVFAVINAESPRVHAFSGNDARFLATLAGQMAVTIERASLYRQLQAHVDVLEQEVAKRTDELRMERDQSLAILESAGEGIFVTDAEAKILYVNPAMERQSGYTRAELLQQSTSLFSSGQTPDAIYRIMWETIMRGEAWSSEMVNKRKDGTFYDVSLSITPVTDAEGTIISFVSVQSDITRLKELDRLKSKFVSNVSHELRTPLTNITTYLTLLEKGREERREHYVKVLKAETERLTRLIQDLLDLSRLETAPAVVEIVPSKLQESLESHYELFLAGAEAKQIHLGLELPATLPLVLIERHHLSQLLTNLLGNAVAYTQEGGQILLSAGVALGSSPPMAWIKVADTGPGISEVDQEHLFERFFRGDDAQLSGTPGTGLGLAICKEIVNRCGGHIEVESALGVGTQFTVWLLMVTE